MGHGGGVTDTDKGWAKIADAFRAAREGCVAKIGVQADDSPRIEGEVTNLELAIIHEFGTPDDHPPERSFLRSTFDAHREEYGKMLENGARKVMSGKLDIDQVVGLIGEKALSDVKQTIDDGIEPPLAASTLMRKTVDGRVGSTPLIDSGQLKAALTVAVCPPEDVDA